MFLQVCSMSSIRARTLSLYVFKELISSLSSSWELKKRKLVCFLKCDVTWKLLLLYLLQLVEVSERSHLTGLMSSKHLTQRTGGNLTGDAVDVHLLPLVVRTRFLSRRRSRRRRRKRKEGAERERRHRSESFSHGWISGVGRLLTSSLCWCSCWLPVCRPRWCSPPAGSWVNRRLRVDPEPPPVCRTGSGNARCWSSWWFEPGTGRAEERTGTEGGFKPFFKPSTPNRRSLSESELQGEKVPGSCQQRS